VSPVTGAILVDQEKCTACRKCIEACPGRIPFLHPKSGKATICNLCDGDPQCVKACHGGRWDSLYIVRKTPGGNEYFHKKLYARLPEDTAKDFVTVIYGEVGRELI